MNPSLFEKMISTIILDLLLKIYEWVASLYMDVQGCKIDTNLYFLCICRCGRHKMYAKFITNVDECVGPM